MTSCAICTKPSADLVLSDDGYLECAPCRSEPARTVDGPDRSYEAQGGLPTIAESQHALHDDAGYQRLLAIDQRHSMKPAHSYTEAERELFEIEKESRRRRRTGAGTYRSHRSSKQLHTLK